MSPDGSKVLFQALGHLYVKDLKTGRQRRLTEQDDHFEFYPSFSRDGAQIVYTTWNEDDLGSIRVVTSSGGSGRVVTSKPGHYVEPAFCPDGKTVVYRKDQGGFLRSPLYSQDPGLYAVPAGGGAATRVSKNGVRPHFGALL